MEKKLKLKIYYLFYLMPVVALAYLMWQNTKPVLEVRCDAGGKTRLCGELVPTARVNKIKDSLSFGASAKNDAIIMEEPVYFDMKLPRKYDTVEAKIEYSDLKTDIFEFGVARDEAKKNFDFVALENKALDNLGWNKMEENGLVLYQRKSIYKNISDFLFNPSKFSETLVYRANLVPKLENMAAKGNTVIDFPVRENIKLLVYKKTGAPQVTVDADGDFNKTIDDLGGGLYGINLAGSEEITFKKISVDSPYAAIANKIKIGHLQKPLTVYFSGSRLLTNAYAAGGAQAIDANGQIINIERVQEQYVSIFKDIKLRPMEIPKGEVELGGALFFVNNKNIFYPRFEPFYSGANLSKINFILAKYSPPQTGDIKTASIIFDISGTPTPNRKIRFLFSLPNAAPSCHSCEGRNLINIKNIELKFTGKNFSLKDIFGKIFKKL